MVAQSSLEKYALFSLGQDAQVWCRMTRCAFEHDFDELLFRRVGKIRELIAGERRKDRSGSPKVRWGS